MKPTEKDLVINKIREMPEEQVSKVLIFIAGLSVPRNSLPFPFLLPWPFPMAFPVRHFAIPITLILYPPSPGSRLLPAWSAIYAWFR